jgi:hypothetical protein
MSKNVKTVSNLMLFDVFNVLVSDIKGGTWTEGAEEDMG